MEEVIHTPEKKTFNYIPVLAGIILLLLLIILSLYFFSSKQGLQNVVPQKIEISNNTPQIHGPILLKHGEKNTDLYTYNYETNTTEKIYTINELIYNLKIAPNGESFYYITEKDFYKTTMFIVNNLHETKKIVLADNNIWTLISHPSRSDSISNTFDCFWSPDSTRIACDFTEHQPSTEGFGAGTGRTHTKVFNLLDNSSSIVFENTQIEPVTPLRTKTHLAGWINSNKLLFFNERDNGIDSIPADFYSVDTVSKSVKKEFSDYYGTIQEATIQILPDATVFYKSSSRETKEAFIKYNLSSGVREVLLESDNILDDPVLSPDKSILVMQETIFSKDLTNYGSSNIDNIRKSTTYKLHFYTVSTGVLKTTVPPHLNGALDAVINENMVIDGKNPFEQYLLNLQTNEFKKLEGIYVGNM